MGAWVVIAGLLSCALHWGVPPAARWSVGEVRSLAAEPGLGPQLEQELWAALSGARMASPGAPPLDALITEASLAPGGRSGDTILYAARLTVRFTAGGTEARVWSISRSRLLADPGTAALAQEARAALFSALIREIAQDAVMRL